MALAIGDQIPDIELKSLTGERYARRELTSDPSLFILLRHLG